MSESPDPLVSYRWDKTEASDALQAYTLRPVTQWTEQATSFVVDKPTPDRLTIRVTGTGSIRLDFGLESAAWLEFDSPDLSGAVTMSISEYNEPAVENTGPAHRIKTAAPVRYGNTYRLELNRALYEGVRFGWIHVVDFERPWTITDVRAVCQVKPTNYNGSFSCSDPMLTQIWYTGAYVVKANLCKDYFGAILMDRGDRISWTGDAHPAQAAALVAFGNWDFVRFNLERTAKVSNGIESYSLYWILSLCDYFLYTGDQETFIKYTQHACALLDHGIAIYSDPPMSFYGWDERLGAGFEEPDNAETKAAYRMLWIRACQSFALLAKQAGAKEISERYLNEARKKADEELRDPQWFQKLGPHALADAVNTQMLDERLHDAIFTQAFANRLNRLSYSPFNQYFILQALAALSRHDEALTSVHDLWGGQIQYGGTMFFETYAPSWNQAVGRNGAVPNCQAGYTSLAHPWGAGVTAWLTREILGVRPTSPGFATVDIFPRLSRELTWVSGAAPTPHGDIKIHVDWRKGQCSLTIPSGVTARLGIPAFDNRIRRVVLNQKQIWSHGEAAPRDEAIEVLTSRYIVIRNLQAGRHNIDVTYASAPAAFNAEPMQYPSALAHRDAGTSGDWRNRYGVDGYVLFCYDGASADRTSLPSYIASVEPSVRKNGRALRLQLVSGVQDKRAPQDLRAEAKLRNCGQLHTGDPIACQQTMMVDVRLKHPHRYRISLYVVDWDRQMRRQAIELFDLASLNRTAPVEAIDEFAEGKYLSYQCEQSIRIRINQIRGPNAVLNALFFDSV